MATKQDRPAPIVAELGRAETPEETAARKAENSRRHKANQTLINLVVALVASLGIVLFLVVVVVRPDPAPRESVDYSLVAEQAQPAVDVPLASPVLPGEWSANAASLGKTSGIATWKIGFITPKAQYIELDQGIDANPTWVSNLLKNGAATGTQTIDGIEWTLYDNRTGDDPGNLAYAMTTTSGASSYVLFGTAEVEEFLALATAVASEFDLAEFGQPQSGDSE